MKVKGNVGEGTTCQQLVAIGNPGECISGGKNNLLGSLCVGQFNDSCARGLEAGSLCFVRPHGVWNPGVNSQNFSAPNKICYDFPQGLWPGG